MLGGSPLDGQLVYSILYQWVYVHLECSKEIRCSLEMLAQ